MKAIKHLFLAILTLAALASGAWPQASDSTAPAPRKKHKPVAAAPAPPAITAADIQALKDGLAAQQQQIQQLTQQLKQAKQNGQQAQAAAADAANKAAAAQTQASQQQQTVVELKSDVADLKTSATNAALTLQETEKNFSAFQSPTTLHIKGISITPGGFAEAAFVRRSRELGVALPPPFNSLPMPGASQNHLSDFFGSARQSRPTIFIAGRLKNVELSSYMSVDFLAARQFTAFNPSTYSLAERRSRRLRLRRSHPCP